VTAAVSRSAFARATSSAAGDTSLATTAASARSLASVIASAPEPVPTSAMRGATPSAGAPSRAVASSTSVSVSGRGTSTRASTANSSFQNSLRPVR